MAQGRLLPVLDGLDEMHEDFQEEAFAELNREPGRPLVVAMRESAFRKVTADGSVLRAAAVVNLRPLESTDVAAYLARAPVEWDTVLQRLCDDDPDVRHLRGVLTNPLMAALARRAYGPKGAGIRRSCWRTAGRPRSQPSRTSCWTASYPPATRRGRPGSSRARSPYGTARNRRRSGSLAWART